MNPEEFLKYLADHGGQALVGNPETLQVAKKMVKADLLEKVGEKDGNPYFRLTAKGTEFVGYSLARLPGPTDKHAKAKGTLKTIGRMVDSYIQAYKQEHPVGVEDLKRTMSIFSSDVKSSEDWLKLPDVAPMQLDTPQPKRLTQKKAKPKPEEYIVIDGKKYRKVD